MQNKYIRFAENHSLLTFRLMTLAIFLQFSDIFDLFYRFVKEEVIQRYSAAKKLIPRGFILRCH